MIEIASDTVICGLSPSNMKTLTVTLLILDFHNQINSLNLLLYRTQRITEKYPINLNFEFLLIACSFFKWDDEKAHEFNEEQAREQGKVTWEDIWRPTGKSKSSGTTS